MPKIKNKSVAQICFVEGVYAINTVFIFLLFKEYLFRYTCFISASK